MAGFVRARIDDDLKVAASAVLDDIGLSVSDVIRVLLTRIAKEKTIPLGLFTPNAVTLAAMQESREIMNRRTRKFTTAQEMFGVLEGRKTQAKA